MEPPRKITDLTVVMAPLWILTAVFLLAVSAVQAQEAKWRDLGKEAEALMASLLEEDVLMVPGYAFDATGGRAEPVST